MAKYCTYLLLGCVVALATLDTACCTSDQVIYDISTQQTCVEVTEEAPTYNCRWVSGLNLNVDEVILKGGIIAYQIQWFNGAWSGWYVTGLNDLDWKFNTHATSCSIAAVSNGMRRAWSYFYDHTHRYILCKDPTPTIATPTVATPAEIHLVDSLLHQKQPA